MVTSVPWGLKLVFSGLCFVGGVGWAMLAFNETAPKPAPEKTDHE